MVSVAAPAPDRTASVFIRNIVSGWLSRLAMMAVSFVATGVLAHHLGPQLYGLWAIAFTLTSYLGFVDVGVNGGLIRVVSAATARGDHLRVSGYVATALVFYVVLGLVILLAVTIGRTWLAALLGVPHHLLPTAGWLLVAVTTIFVLSNLMYVFNGVLNALEAIHLSSLVNVVLSFMNAIGIIVAALVLRAGIGGLAAINVGAAVLALLFSAVLARRICAHVRFNPGLVAWARIREVTGVSLSMQVSNMAGVVNFTVDRFIVARFLGLASAGLYDLGSRLTTISWILCWMVASAAFPVASRLNEESPGLIKAFYLRAERYLLLTSCGLTGLLVVTAPWIIRVWLGPGYLRAILVTQVLALAGGGLALTNVAKVTLWGMGQIKETTVFEVWRLVMHVVLSCLLTWRLGFNGALIGALFSLTVPSAWLLWIAHRRLDVSHTAWLRSAALGPGAAAAIAGLLTWFLVNTVLFHALGPLSRGTSLVLLVLSTALYGATFIVALFQFRVFPEDELLTFRRSRAAVWSRLVSMRGT